LKKENTMKKLIIPVAVTILAITLLAGCGGVKTYTDPDQTIATGPGDEFVIALDSNPTTGYDWQGDFDPDLIALVDENYKPDEKAAGLVGAGGTRYFRFTARKTGKTEITLVYKRSWETEVLETRVFTIEIK